MGREVASTSGVDEDKVCESAECAWRVGCGGCGCRGGCRGGCRVGCCVCRAVCVSCVRVGRGVSAKAGVAPKGVSEPLRGSPGGAGGVPEGKVPLENTVELDSDVEFHREIVDSCTKAEGDFGEGKYRLRAMRVLLTYSFHVPKDWLRTFLWWTCCQITGNRCQTDPQIMAKFECIIAHETGKTGHMHTHAYIDAGIQLDTYDCRVFDIKDPPAGCEPHPNIRPVNKTPKRVIAYVCKEDDDPVIAALRVKYPMDKLNPRKPKMDLFDMVAACKDKNAALRLAGCDPKSVSGVVAMWKEMQRPTQLWIAEHWKPYGWQLDMLNAVKGRPDGRSILNWWNERGELGKTQILKYLAAKYPNKFLPIQGISCIRNIAEVVKNGLAKGWNGHCVIINLTRSTTSKQVDIADVLEQLADGLITSEKYSGDTMLFNGPHIVVLSNYQLSPYEVNADGSNGRLLLSLDRIKNYYVVPTEDRGNTWMDAIEYEDLVLDEDLEKLIDERKREVPVKVHTWKGAAETAGPITKDSSLTPEQKMWKTFCQQLGLHPANPHLPEGTQRRWEAYKALLLTPM